MVYMNKNKSVFSATLANYFAPFAVKNNNRKERRDFTQRTQSVFSATFANHFAPFAVKK